MLRIMKHFHISTNILHMPKDFFLITTIFSVQTIFISHFLCIGASGNWNDSNNQVGALVIVKTEPRMKQIILQLKPLQLRNKFKI